MNRRKLLTFGAAGLALLCAASLAPSPYSAVRKEKGGVVLAGSQLDSAAGNLLRRACGDCHSNETRWPWYANVAPVSWMLERDVTEARRFMNFSLWSEYGAEGERQLLDLAVADIQSGKMPPARYRVLHPEARLSQAEKQILITGLPQESRRLTSVQTNK